MKLKKLLISDNGAIDYLAIGDIFTLDDNALYFKVIAKGKKRMLAKVIKGKGIVHHPKNIKLLSPQR